MTSFSAHHATETGKLKGAACLLATTVVFGVGNVIQKAVLTEMDSWMALALRSALALVCLAPWAYGELKTIWPQRQKLYGLLPLVIIGFGFGISLQSLGVGMTSATNMGFLVNLSVIFTPLLCWLSGEQKLDRATVLACVTSLLGAALLSHGSPSQPGLGDLLCVGAAIGFAVWIIAVQKASSELSCPALITFAQWIVPMVLGFGMTDQDLSTVANFSSTAWIELAFVGIGVSGLAFLVAADAQAKISSVTASLIYPAEAVFGATAAYLWLGETMSQLAMIGACIVMLSIAIVSLPQGSFKIPTLQWRFS